jgi:hypothetical protein
MAKFVIHKKGFFYTDDSWEDVNAKGTVVSIFDTLEEAKAEKINQDILSTQKLAGYRCEEFYLSSNRFDEIDKKVQAFIEAEYNLKMDRDFLLPGNLSFSKAEELMNIMEFSFHDIVEYTDEDAPIPKDQSVIKEYSEDDEEDYEEDELQEF